MPENIIFAKIIGDTKVDVSERSDEYIIRIHTPDGVEHGFVHVRQEADSVRDIQDIVFPYLVELIDKLAKNMMKIQEALRPLGVVR